jgi:hypothetical protein
MLNRKCTLGLLLAAGMISVTLADDPPVTCDGRTPEWIKCQDPPNAPTNYVESQNCQGVLSGAVACDHAIAWNNHNFGCTTPQPDPLYPSYYTTYCVDSTQQEECTRWQKCIGTLLHDRLGSYTECKPDGKQIVKMRLVKKKLIYDSKMIKERCTPDKINP